MFLQEGRSSLPGLSWWFELLPSSAWLLFPKLAHGGFDRQKTVGKSQAAIPTSRSYIRKIVEEP